MRTVIQIRNEEREVVSMGAMIASFEEITARRMQEVRVGRELSREYFSGLSRISTEVGLDLTNKGLVGAQIEAVVVLGANGAMYGDLTQKVILEVGKYLQEKHPGDVFVVGQVASDMLYSLMPELKFETTTIKDEVWDPSWWSSVVERLKMYRAVKVFYGEFVNLVQQKAVSRELSGEFSWDHISNQTKQERKEHMSYLYEPSIEAVGKVFSGEVFAQILEDTWMDSRLAKFASRLIQLDNVVLGIEKKVRKLRVGRVQAKKRYSEKRRGQLLASRKVRI